MIHFLKSLTAKQANKKLTRDLKKTEITIKTARNIRPHDTAQDISTVKYSMTWLCKAMSSKLTLSQAMPCMQHSAFAIISHGVPVSCKCSQLQVTL